MKEREREDQERVCVCGRGALCHHQLHTVLTMRRVVVAAARRAQPCAAHQHHTGLPSGPHQTCGSARFVMPGENSSGRAFPYYLYTVRMYNAVIFDLVKYIPSMVLAAFIPLGQTNMTNFDINAL